MQVCVLMYITTKRSTPILHTTARTENALMAFEKDNQGYDNAVRQKAMQELGKMGKMSTETNIRLWRDKYEEAFFQSQQAQGSVQAGKSA